MIIDRGDKLLRDSGGFILSIEGGEKEPNLMTNTKLRDTDVGNFVSRDLLDSLDNMSKVIVSYIEDNLPLRNG